MSLAKGRFGIEYDPRRRRDDSSGPGWLVLVVAALLVFAKFGILDQLDKKRAAQQGLASITQPARGLTGVSPLPAAKATLTHAGLDTHFPA